MKSVITIFIVLITSFLQVQGQSSDMLIGKFDKGAFLEDPYREWFIREYDSYQPSDEVLDQVKVSNVLSIKVFMGTWCSDSRREVPRFLKICDRLGLDSRRISLIGLDREKSAPGIEMDRWAIEYVPTFIFMRGNKEIGRIIETPIKSLEEDFLDIISQK